MERLVTVNGDIADACEDAGRDPASVTLVAISKTFGEEEIVPVLEAGQRVFGENRVQEAQAKWPALRGRYPGIELHLVGPLQSNKAKEAVALFDFIHTVDRPKIAAALADEMKKQNRKPRLLIQVNTGAEPQKAGVLPEQSDAFL
jgi:pyridoxal phosphate enzyme (YggS family)